MNQSGKSKPKAYRHFKVDPVLKIDETLFKQAESMWQYNICFSRGVYVEFSRGGEGRSCTNLTWIIQLFSFIFEIFPLSKIYIVECVQYTVYSIVYTWCRKTMKKKYRIGYDRCWDDLRRFNMNKMNIQARYLSNKLSGKV